MPKPLSTQGNMILYNYFPTTVTCLCCFLTTRIQCDWFNSLHQIMQSICFIILCFGITILTDEGCFNSCSEDSKLRKTKMQSTGNNLVHFSWYTGDAVHKNTNSGRYGNQWKHGFHGLMRKHCLT